MGTWFAQIDAIVTTGGGIEEDFMKCFTPAYLGDFNLTGTTLRKKGTRCPHREGGKLSMRH